MSEKLTSPSSSSSNSAHTNRSRDAPYLVVRQEPPSQLYVEEPFSITVGLEIPSTSSPESKEDAGEVFLTTSLHHHKSDALVNDDIVALVVDPVTASINSQDSHAARQTTFQCVIRSTSNRSDQYSSFVVRISQRTDIVQPMRNVAPVVTKTFRVVRYKLRIRTHADWENVWYKDQGGREKSMEAHVSFHDSSNQKLTGVNVPLHVSLHYDTPGSPRKVMNQSIMKLMGEPPHIDPETGSGKLRFRVEEVSKNHQNQNFMVKVAPDPRVRRFADLGYGYTPAVSVRSKLSKRARMSSSNSRTSTTSSVRGSPTARRRTAYEEHPTARELFHDVTDVSRLREAMTDVLNWADVVVKGLFALQWRVIGYHRNPDGTSDYTRPYHNMPNPNECISRVLTSYRDSVRDSLGVLTQAVERSSPPRPGGAYMFDAPVIPGEPDDQYSLMMHPPAAQPGPMHMTIPGAARALQQQSPQRQQQAQQLSPHSQPQPTSQTQQAPTQSQAQAQSSQQRQQQQPDTFRAKQEELSFQHAVAQSVARRAPMGQSGFHPLTSQLATSETSQMYMRAPNPMLQSPPTDEKPAALERLSQGFLGEHDDSREGDVEYVVTKQYKAQRTGERLGCPAYDANKRLLGFYRDSPTVGVYPFTPISQLTDKFDPMEILQASDILEDALRTNSRAVRLVRDYASISDLMDRAYYMDWRQNLADDPSRGSAS